MSAEALTTRELPKSMRQIWHDSVSMTMFAGLMSRCSTAHECKYYRARKEIVIGGKPKSLRAHLEGADKLVDDVADEIGAKGLALVVAQQRCKAHAVVLGADVNVLIMFVDRYKPDDIGVG